MANAQAATSPGSGGFELPLLRWFWRGLTSVRFALALIGFLATASMLGVLVPQVPAPMRDNPAAIDAWLEFQRGRFGFFTDPFYRLGLFDVFRSLWFASGLGVLVASVCVCTANRLPPVWRNVSHPQTRVPDDYFAADQAIAGIEAPDGHALAAALRRRRYKVTLIEENGATYLFADRFPWSQLATFVSHLALILFLAGGLVTLISAHEVQILVAEGEAAQPIFSTDDRDHMQLYVEDAVGSFNPSGFPLDFRTYLVVYRNGEEVARGVSTVNSPLSYGGYRFHQSAYFPDGAALQVRDRQSGRVVYDEVLALTSAAATPRLVVRDTTGSTLLDDLIVPTDFLGDAAGTLVTVPGTGREFWVGARPSSDQSGWQLIVFETGTSAAGVVIAEGDSTDMTGLNFDFVGVGSLPSTVVMSLPGADADAVAELGNDDAGALTVGPIDGHALVLTPGQPVAQGDYEYVFAGKREFAGITVRRDPGSAFIWLATGTFLLGLALTFYTPRRRLWGKIAAGQASFRGLGGRRLAIEREIRAAASRAAAQRGT